jgi:predicted MFS family arabinose efflux permease
MDMVVDLSADRADTRLATRLAFLAAGLATACWAPLVPFAKERVGVDDRGLGLVLLCLGIGSLMAMPLTGWLSARVGAKPMILLGGFGLVLVLPLLALASTPVALAGVLLVFGASLGTIDVAMNVHALEVEQAARRPLMSGFHAMFSVGGIVGAGGVTALLSAGLTPLGSTLVGSALTLLALLVAWPRFLGAKGGEPTPFVLPRGSVLLIAGLAGLTFLVEGAILDWGALYLSGEGLVGAEQGGAGYMLFAVAMTIGRLTGDGVVAALGGRRILLWGGLATLAGFLVLLLAPWAALALAGFVLVGLGAANIVPVLFSQAGRQRVMPASLAVAAVTTTGYAGVLLGPAAMGFVSHATSLPGAFWFITMLVLLLPLSARAATRD